MSEEKAKVEGEGVVATEVEQTTPEEVTAGSSTDAVTPETTEEVVVTIGDQEPPKDETESAPEWVRELRRVNREQARELRELKKAQQERSTASAIVVGPRPMMKDEDIDYDPEKFEAKLNEWNDRKRAADAEAAQRQEAEKKAKEDWEAQLARYESAKEALKVPDFEDARAVASDVLSVTQQGIIVSGADNPALVVYALGKNPAKLKELAAITDPVKFSFATAKLEKDLKMTTRKAPPPPEKTVTGSAPLSGVTDSTLERLRAEAAKTGDYSKVVAHKRLNRAAG